MVGLKAGGGPLILRLPHLQPGNHILVSRKPTGTLALADLRPDKGLDLLGTGTTPFIGLIREPEPHARFEKLGLVHGVRRVSELAYRDRLEKALLQHRYLGEDVRAKPLYYSTVTHEPFVHRTVSHHLADCNRPALRRSSVASSIARTGSRDDVRRTRNVGGPANAAGCAQFRSLAWANPRLRHRLFIH